MKNFKQFTGETLSSKQKNGSFKFPVLRGYHLQMVADAERKDQVYYVCKRIT